MRPILKNSRGSGAIIAALVVSVGGLLIATYLNSGLNTQRAVERKSSQQHLNHLVLNAVVSKVLTDLQLATRYPDAESLQSPPCHADLGSSYACTATKCLRYQPCDNKDKDDSNHFTLDAYLLRGVAPGYDSNTCTYPAGTPPAQRPQRCKLPHPGYYVALNTQKKISYPKGAFRVSASGGTGYLTPESDPSVTIKKIAAELYQVDISFSICDPGFVRSAPDPNDTVAVNATRGVNWSTTCDPNSKATLVYNGLLNTKADYVQGTVGAIALATTSNPFDGTFSGSGSGSSVTSTTIGGGSSATTTTMGGGSSSTTTTIPPSPNMFTLGFYITLNQSGSNVTGSWRDYSGSHSGAVNGTASGNTATLSLTHNSCTGTLNAAATKLSNGNLTLVISGILGSPCGKISATATATPQ